MKRKSAIVQGAGFALALTLLGGVAWLNVRHATHVQESAHWVTHTEQVRLALGELLSVMQDVETGMRGFVLTGRRDFLEPYDAALQAQSAKLRSLRDLIADNPAQQHNLDELARLINRRLDRSAIAVQLRRDAGFGPAQAEVANGEGRTSMDAIRASIAKMDAVEEKLLEERAAVSRHETDIAREITLAGSLLSFVLFLGVFALVLRENRLRRQANLALRTSEENLAVTLESIGDAVMATDAGGRLTWLNTVAETLTGWTRAEAIGRPVGEVFRIVNETTRQPAILPTADTLAKGTVHGLSNHTLLLARDGTERPIADNCSPIHSREGRVVGAVLVFRDQSTERQIAQKLDQMRRHQELLFTSVADGMYGLNLDGSINFGNPAAERMLGYAKGELLGRPAHATIHHHNADRSISPVEQCPVYVTMHDGQTRTVRDEVFWRKDGTCFPVEYVVSPVTDEKGVRGGVIVAFRDAIEHQKQEAELRRAIVAIEAMQDAVFMFAPDTLRLFFVNGGALRQVGYSREELLTMTPLDLKPAFTAAQYRAMVAPLLDGRVASLQFTTVHRHKDGRDIPVEIILQTVGKDEERCLVALCRDVSERQHSEKTLREAHEELSRVNVELAQTSKLKDEFLANMSHELRTPLNAILGLSEALLEQVSGPLTPRQMRSVTTISTSGTHLLTLINDILDLSKIEAGKLELHPEPLNVDEFCQSCLAFVRAQAMQKHIGVAFELDGSVARFVGDPKRCKQILVNLLNNAVKFTPEGGRIGLKVGVPDGEDAVRFTVWDTGIGIAPENQGKLFRAFTQIDSGLSRAQEGTGLGLALVARLAELHGGSVALESEEGKGSRFIVTLPQPAEPAPVLSPEVEAGANRRVYRRALIIEDDVTASEQLVRYLSELGLSSVQHARGNETMEVVLRERPDVILLDIQLPGESGWQVLTRLKEHPQTRDIPVVVVSVVDEPMKSSSLGAAAHFTKPVTRAQLAAFFNRPAAHALLPAPPCAVALRGSGPLILLAEDNEANIETIGGYLEDKGFALRYARNGLDAVQSAQEFHPALILMDIQMPVMDGLTATREIRRNSALHGIPIVVLTALVMPGDRERCLEAGATDYMSKPVKLAVLAAMVDRLVATNGTAKRGEAAPATAHGRMIQLWQP